MMQEPAAGQATNLSPNTEERPVATATFGGGCFWCTEAFFQRLRGVQSVMPGYSGGTTEAPSYEQVCLGNTGHAEVIQVKFDPQLISYVELLEVFWGTHDPTTLNRQGGDVGTQYRSVIFAHDGEQRRLAEEYKRKLDESKTFSQPVVTEIVDFEKFHPAEKYHRDYFNRNGSQSYCQAVIHPKLEKFQKVFREKLARP